MTPSVLTTWQFEPLAAVPVAALAVCYLLLLAGMPADIVTGAVLMLRGPFGPFGAADVRTAGITMLGGSDLIMTGLAVALVAALLTERARRASRPADLTGYNAYLASLDAPRAHGGLAARARGQPATCGPGQAASLGRAAVAD